MRPRALVSRVSVSGAPRNPVCETADIG